MQVQFKDKKNYLKDELKKLEGFEMGWVMKEYDDAENGNAVSLYGLDKGQALVSTTKVHAPPWHYSPAMSLNTCSTRRAIPLCSPMMTWKVPSTTPSNLSPSQRHRRLP